MKKPVRSVYRKRRIFLDTNVILDFFLEREPFYYDALKLWAACEEGAVDGYVSALTITNVHYIAQRIKSPTTAMIAVRGILDVFNVVPLDKELLHRAANLHDRDYEVGSCPRKGKKTKRPKKKKKPRTLQVINS